MHAGHAWAHREAAERGAVDEEGQRRRLAVPPRLHDLEEELLGVEDEVLEADEGVAVGGGVRLGLAVAMRVERPDGEARLCEDGVACGAAKGSECGVAQRQERLGAAGVDKQAGFWHGADRCGDSWVLGNGVDLI